MRAIKPAPEFENFWFPTPESCENPNFLTPTQTQIHDRVTHFKSLELCEPKPNDTNSIGKIPY